MLSRTQAESGRTAKQEQEQILPNHVPTIFHFSVSARGDRGNMLFVAYGAVFGGVGGNARARKGRGCLMRHVMSTTDLTRKPHPQTYFHPLSRRSIDAFHEFNGTYNMIGWLNLVFGPSWYCFLQFVTFEVAEKYEQAPAEALGRGREDHILRR